MADPPDAATRSRPVVRGPGQLADIDVLVVEEPLEIRVEERALAVTMRTPGSDLELAAGFLLAEGVVDGADDLVSLAHLPGDVDGNTVVARVAGGVEAHLEAIERASRDLYASSACGICGSVSLDRVEMLATFPVEPRGAARRRIGRATRGPTVAATHVRTDGRHPRRGAREPQRPDRGRARGCGSAQCGRQGVGVASTAGCAPRARPTPSGERSCRVRDRAQGEGRRGRRHRSHRCSIHVVGGSRGTVWDGPRGVSASATVDALLLTVRLLDRTNARPKWKYPRTFSVS